MSIPMPGRSPVLSPFWRNQLRQWHWISSALCLIALLLFSVTGFTLNHAAQIAAKPKTMHVEKDLPEADLTLIGQAKNARPLPDALRSAVKALTGVDTGHALAQVSDGEIYVDLTTPGVDNSVTIEDDGHVTWERTDRGPIAVLNDLHKGRHAGPVWSLFIDLIALACVVFAVTGLGLLWLYEKNRRITWPLVALGTLLPFIIFMLFVHN
jgi:hypothetical protein